MFKILVLVCAAGTDPAACTPETALDVVRAAPAGSMAGCGFLGQAQIAPTALAPVAGRHYLKMICYRPKSLLH